MQVCNAWLDGFNGRCYLDKGHGERCLPHPICREPKGKGTCFLYEGHVGDHSFEFSGDCGALLTSGSLCRFGKEHKGTCKPRVGAKRTGKTTKMLGLHVNKAVLEVLQALAERTGKTLHYVACVILEEAALAQVRDNRVKHPK